MKAIINGKRYDTGKAEEITRLSYGGKGQFISWEASLHKTAKGEWFLAGKGGPMTMFARSAEGNPGAVEGSSRIVPMEQADVLELLQSLSAHNPGLEAIIEEHFGPEIEDA
ncbi:MAG: hypothetical protein U1B30_15850 [Pseudomonadota bacterium]|nr:hypothetical protein [Pseudomonadota bacterium]